MPTTASFAVGLTDDESIRDFLEELAVSGTRASQLRCYQDMNSGHYFVSMTWEGRKVEIGFPDHSARDLINVDTRPDDSKENSQYSHLISVQPDHSIMVQTGVIPILWTADQNDLEGTNFNPDDEIHVDLSMRF